MFANTPAGAQGSATLYSVLETAKANHVEPNRYLAHLFTELPQRDIDNGDPIDDLLPWNVDLPGPDANGLAKDRCPAQCAFPVTLTVLSPLQHR